MYLLNASEKQDIQCHRIKPKHVVICKEDTISTSGCYICCLVFFLLYGQNYSPSIKTDPGNYPEVLKPNGPQRDSRWLQCWGR